MFRLSDICVALLIRFEKEVCLFVLPVAILDKLLSKQYVRYVLT